ncbi:hypothetical protein V491_02822 [Pseudogymnoascus sp. VKM F-3775]|nr:hypothetical protein V491_02822 [Pseudogymnoascus sp. VKM F-3775]
MTTSQLRIPSQHGTLEYLRLQYDSAILSGVKRPLLFPQVLFSLSLLAGLLLIDHRKSRFLYHLRWPVWFAIIAVEIYNIRHRISVDPAVSYVSGVASIWFIVWSMMWLILEHPQLTAKRIERRRQVLLNESQAATGSTTQRNSKKTMYEMNGNRHSLKWQNGHAAALPAVEKSLGETKYLNGDWEYFWQPYPDTFGERLSWVLDLIFSFRGRGWNFSIPTNPALPEDVAAPLGETVSELNERMISKTGIKSFEPARSWRVM